MKIVLIRHFKVDFKWKFWYTPEEYERDRERYNTAAVVKTNLKYVSDERLISSTMGRTVETSRLIFNRDPYSTDVICEVPIKAFTKSHIVLPKIIWDIVGRIQWRMNLPSQAETFKESSTRVNQFLDEVVSESKDCVIVCHGWVMKLMIARLTAQGFKGPSPIYIRNGVPYEFVR